MNTGRSNAGSIDRPIFIALDSKKCKICRNWKTKDSFSFSEKELICHKCEHEAKLREKIGEEETVKELVQTQPGKQQRE